MKPDSRSMRIALTADRYVNPPPGGLDGLAVLAREGWGVMQLPAADCPAPIARRLLAHLAEQVEEFARGGYEFVLVGECDGLAAALAALGLPLPDRIAPASAAELSRFLAGRAAPAAAHWARLGLSPARRAAGGATAGRE